MEIKYKEIKALLPLPLKEEQIISGIVEDINLVEENMIFVVRKGTSYDAFQDIDTALERQAIVIHQKINETRGYYVASLSQKIKAVLAYFYRDINTLYLVAVCGTNGKSTVVSCLYEMVKSFASCMKIGTHFIEGDGISYPTRNTTPSCITLLHFLKLAKEKKIQYVFMEVSSIAIAEKRIDLLRFDCIIYTNIASDHLDYHQTLLHYRYTKYRLCNYLKKQGKVIACSDELYYVELKQVCHHQIITYGQKAAHFQICDVLLGKEGSTFFVNRYFFSTSLLAMLNVYNLTACIAFLRLCDFSYHQIYRQMIGFTMKGRLQCIYSYPFHVYIDYAHSAKAFYEVISFLSKLSYHHLICVVGCGGEREKEKRSLIGMYATYFADLCIFTEDNARGEDVSFIIEAMCEKAYQSVIIIEERKEAIQYAVKMAENDDIILISGKGDETFLEKKGKKIPFNDREVVLEMLGDRDGN